MMKISGTKLRIKTGTLGDSRVLQCKAIDTLGRLSELVVVSAKLTR